MDSAIVLSKFMSSIIFAMVCGLFEWKRICRFSIIIFYMYCRWRSNCQERVRSTLTGLTPTHFCACPKPGFPKSYVMVFFCSVSSVKMRGDCLFCWYWWNWWSGLLKFSFIISNIFFPLYLCQLTLRVIWV